MGFFNGKTSGVIATLPMATQAQGSTNMGGGTLYGGPHAYDGYQPYASTATTGVGANAQHQALADLSGMSANGWTQQDQAQIRTAQQASDAAESSQRQGLLQEAQRRGQGGGGLQFASALAGQQGGADRMRSGVENIAAQGAQNRFSANQALFGAGGQLEGQAVARGAATDAFNQWASGREGAANQQVYENANNMEQRDQDQENKYWDRLGGLFS